MLGKEIFVEPTTQNAERNRIYDGEGDVTHNETVSNKGDLYAVPNRINSEHNRAVDGELSDTSWPLTDNTDKWFKGIEEVTVNGNDPIAARENRLSATVHEMWQL